MELLNLRGKTVFESLKPVVNERELFGEQRQADQDKDPALNHGQETADDAQEQKEDAEENCHAASNVPNHGGILTNV